MEEGLKMCSKLTIKTYFWKYFAPSSSVSIVDFEHLFVCWDGTIVAASLKIIFLNMNPDVARASTYAAANCCAHCSGFD